MIPKAAKKNEDKPDDMNSPSAIRFLSLSVQARDFGSFKGSDPTTSFFFNGYKK